MPTPRFVVAPALACAVLFVCARSRAQEAPALDPDALRAARRELRSALERDDPDARAAALARVVALDERARAALADGEARLAALERDPGADEDALEALDRALTEAELLLGELREEAAGGESRAERAAWLERARAAYAHVIEWRTQPVGALLAQAGAARCLLALGRNEEAALAGDALSEVRLPQATDPDQASALAALERGLWIEGVATAARARARAGQAEAALRQLDGRCARRPRALEGEGEELRLARVRVAGARGEALVALGDEDEGARGLLAAAAPLPEPAELAAGRARLDPVSREACRLLALLWRAGGGGLGVPAASYYSGLGLLAERDEDAALASWLGVAHEARASAERARLVPAAALAAGALLTARARHLGATLVYVGGLEALGGEGGRVVESLARRALVEVEAAGAQLGEPSDAPSPALASLRARVEALARAAAEDSAWPLVEAARAALRGERWREAARLLAEAAERATDAERGRHLLGAARCLLRAGAPDEARGLLERAVALGPASARVEPRLTLVELELSAGCCEAARAALAPLLGEGALLAGDRALAARAAAARGRIELVAGEHAGGELEEARAAFAAAREADPTGAPTRDLALRLALALDARARALDPGRTPDELRAARRLWAAAAEALPVWLADRAVAADPARELRTVRWAGEVLLAGGDCLRARALLADAAARAAPSAGDEGAQLVAAEAALAAGWAELGAGDPEAAWARFVALRDAVWVRDPDGRLVAVGREVETHASRPVRRRVQGRFVEAPAVVHVLALAEGAAEARERAFVELDLEGDGARAPRVLAGEDPSAAHLPGDERRLERPFAADPRLLDGIARAAAARYAARPDPRFLVRELREVSTRALVALRGQDEARYRRWAAGTPLAPASLEVRRWELELGLLRQGLWREAWGEVQDELRRMDLLGRRPPREGEGAEALARELAELRAAAARGPGGR